MKRLSVMFIVIVPLFTLKAWERTYGGDDSDLGYSVQQTSDGDYIIVGETNSFGKGGADVYLIKTDSLGNLRFSRTYGDSGDDRGFSVKQTSDGGYIIAGGTDSYGAGLADVYLIKTDSAGNLLWQKTYGGNSVDLGLSVQETQDGGYIISGVTTSFGAGKNDVYLLKTDANGDTVWSKTFGGSGSDWGNSVQQTSEGGYIIAGMTDSYDARSFDVYLIKTSDSGNFSWSKTYGGSTVDYSGSVQETRDRGYIIAGRTTSVDTIGDVYLIKTDSLGNLNFSKTFGGSDWDEGHSVQQTEDGGYIIAGQTYSYGAGWGDVYLVKADTAGNLVWDKTFGGSGVDVGLSVQQTQDDGYIITGGKESFYDDMDVYLIKTDSLGRSGLEEPRETKIASGLLLNVQSPADGRIIFSYFIPVFSYVKVELYDIAGRRAAVLADGERQTGWRHFTRALGLPSGIYFVRLFATPQGGLNSSSIARKIILVR
jgi:hypothetical protein